jgi:hypothetical protein
MCSARLFIARKQTTDIAALQFFTSNLQDHPTTVD